MTFLAPWWLLALAAVPILVVAYSLVIRQRTAKRPTGFVLTSSDGNPHVRRRHVPPAIFLLALTSLVFSFARPEANVTLPVRTGQILLAFDTSNSMVADDVEPTRLDVAKAAAIDFVGAQPGSVQIGVVAFTNGGLVVQTPTKDQNEVITAIERLTTDGGTSIGEGIFASLTAIADEPIELLPEVIEVDIAALDIGYYSNAAIVVFTDGEDLGGADPVEIAGLAANAGVPIHTVGIGTPRGTVVTLDGFSIATALDEEVLTAIAETTGGSYLLAADDPDLTSIFDDIDRSFERQGERIEITALFAMVAAALLLMGAALSIKWFGRV